MRTLFTSAQSKKVCSSPALAGGSCRSCHHRSSLVAAFAEANGSAGGPAGGAFMSSYGPRGNWAKEPYPFQVSPSAVYPRQRSLLALPRRAGSVQPLRPLTGRVGALWRVIARAALSGSRSAVVDLPATGSSLKAKAIGDALGQLPASIDRSNGAPVALAHHPMKLHGCRPQAVA